MQKTQMLCLILLLYFSQIRSITIGSDTTVNRFNTQVTLNNSDIVAGFAALQGGFFLSDSTVTASWSSFFPVSGNLIFNNGTIVLLRDLVLSNVASIVSMGNIIGNNYVVDLAPSTTLLISACGQTLQTSISTGLRAITNSSGWSYDDRFIAVGGTASPTNELEVYLFNGTSLSLASVQSSLPSVRAVGWNSQDYYLAVGTSSGTNLYVYSVNGGTGALTLASSAFLSGGNVNDLAWHPTNSYIALASSRNTSEIVLYPINATGILGTPLLINRPDQAQSCDWSFTGSYLAVGFVNSAANEIELYELTAGPTLTLRVSNSPNFSVSCLRWNPVYTDVFAAGLSNTGSGNNVIMYRYNATTNTLSQIAAISGLAAVVTGVDWSPDGNCLLVAIGSTAATANKLRIYRFNNNTNSLLLNQGFTFLNASSTANPASFSRINGYIAQAVAPAASTNSLRIYTPIIPCFNCINTIFSLFNDLILESQCITFSGQCLIQGNGNLLQLDTNTRLSVAGNSALTLKNLTIAGVEASSLQMIAPSSNLILDNVTLLMDDVVSFTQGSLVVKRQVNFSGDDSQFIYASIEPCVINPQSQLFIDNNVTFSYAPANNSATLLQFTDSSSELFLNGAKLFVFNGGLNLLKGTLLVNRHVEVNTFSSLALEGIVFGDGVNVNNNMTIQLYPDAIMEVLNGSLINNNV